MWRALFGSAAEPARRACRVATGDPALRQCPAVFMADESKAFERLGVHWLQQVMAAWRFPGWAREARSGLPCLFLQAPIVLTRSSVRRS